MTAKEALIKAKEYKGKYVSIPYQKEDGSTGYKGRMVMEMVWIPGMGIKASVLGDVSVLLYNVKEDEWLDLY